MKSTKRHVYLNYVEHYLILISRITGCVSISAFASLVCAPDDITSSAVGMKFMQSLEQWKSISQFSRKRRRRRSMMK